LIWKSLTVCASAVDCQVSESTGRCRSGNKVKVPASRRIAVEIVDRAAQTPKFETVPWDLHTGCARAVRLPPAKRDPADLRPDQKAHVGRRPLPERQLSAAVGSSAAAPVSMVPPSVENQLECGSDA
jgi:hypothetical protein